MRVGDHALHVHAQRAARGRDEGVFVGLRGGQPYERRPASRPIDSPRRRDVPVGRVEKDVGRCYVGYPPDVGIEVAE